MSARSLAAFCKLDEAVGNVARCAEEIYNTACGNSGVDNKVEVSSALMDKLRDTIKLWTDAKEALSAIVSEEK